jgi:hypothetical protein
MFRTSVCRDCRYIFLIYYLREYSSFHCITRFWRRCHALAYKLVPEICYRTTESNCTMRLWGSALRHWALEVAAKVTEDRASSRGGMETNVDHFLDNRMLQARRSWKFDISLKNRNICELTWFRKRTKNDRTRLFWNSIQLSTWNSDHPRLVQ